MGRDEGTGSAWAEPGTASTRRTTQPHISYTDPRPNGVHLRGRAVPGCGASNPCRATGWLLGAQGRPFGHRANERAPASQYSRRVDLETGQTRMIEAETIDAASTIKAAEIARSAVSDAGDNPRLSRQCALPSRQACARLAGPAGPPDQAALHPGLLPAPQPHRAIMGREYKHVTHSKCYATSREFAGAVLTFLREKVPQNWRGSARFGHGQLPRRQPKGFSGFVVNWAYCRSSVNSFGAWASSAFHRTNAARIRSETRKPRSFDDQVEHLFTFAALPQVTLPTLAFIGFCRHIKEFAKEYLTRSSKT